eukprot:CAMPEP_0195540292 /NCGR_PEP_ID=MMETSP0794_2-20130614/50496_1 /TAXON_ID=515487 /ORGANISM="Stephanopyxis turris, Strain CCMP 815" /LENGTH=1135 /DNA_ID=CAMNT_0040674357 /DNA_START=409 /DNA_END=3816 /DNA_ORIENTATION=-
MNEHDAAADDEDEMIEGANNNKKNENDDDIDMNKQPNLRSRLMKRFWRDKGTPVQQIPLPSESHSNTPSKHENSKSDSLPDWLRKEQEERQRLRLEAKRKGQPVFPSSTSTSTVEKGEEKGQEQQQPRKVISTTANLDAMMEGMPSLNDMFGESDAATAGADDVADDTSSLSSNDNTMDVSAVNAKEEAESQSPSTQESLSTFSDENVNEEAKQRFIEMQRNLRKEMGISSDPVAVAAATAVDSNRRNKIHDVEDDADSSSSASLTIEEEKEEYDILNAARRRNGLQERLDDLMARANSANEASLSSSSSSYSSSSSSSYSSYSSSGDNNYGDEVGSTDRDYESADSDIDDKSDDYEISSTTYNSDTDTIYPNDQFIPKAVSTSEQRYRSFAATSRDDDDDAAGDKNKKAFEAFLKKEQELREKAGFTSLAEDDDDDEEEVDSDSQIPNTTIARDDEDSNGLTELERLSKTYSSGAWKGNQSAASDTAVIEGDSSEMPDTPPIRGDDDDDDDGLGTNPSMVNFQTKTQSISDARYRSFAATKSSDSNKAAFEAFLKKEQEMRANISKIGQAQEEDMGKEAKTGTDVLPTQGAWLDDDAEEEERDAMGTTSVQEVPLEEANLADRDTSAVETYDKLQPKARSTAEQRFRSFSKAGVTKDKQDAWEAFLKKEQELREKAGLTSSHDDDDIVQEEDASSSSAWTGVNTATGVHPPNTLFFKGEDVATTQDIIQEEQVPPPTTSFSQHEEFDTTLLEKEQEQKQPSSTTYSRPSDPYDLSETLFNRDYFGEPSKIEKTDFSSFHARKADLLEYNELDVSDLNFLFEHDTLTRLAAINNPNSAYGAIFRLEGTLVDTTELQMEIWEKVAKEHGFEPPLREEVKLAQLMRPDAAVRNLFYWTTDIFESRDIALSHYDSLEETFQDILSRIHNNKTNTDTAINGDESTNATSIKEGNTTTAPQEPISFLVNSTDPAEIFPVIEGASEWLNSLRDANIPLSIISHLDKEKLSTILNLTNLSEYFPLDLRVSSNDGYEREMQEFLGAALRLERRPDHCMVFDTTPSSSIAAHDAEMVAVSFMGLYPMYDLCTADLTIAGFEDLTVMNIRRLFGDKSFEPEVELEPIKPKVQRSKIRIWTEGDRN